MIPGLFEVRTFPAIHPHCTTACGHCNKNIQSYTPATRITDETGVQMLFHPGCAMPFMQRVIDALNIQPPPRAKPVEIEPVGKWGKYNEYLAKVGTFSGCIVLIKRVRKFLEGQRIEYCDTKDLRGMAKGFPPKWESGRIWKIEDGRLFISKI